MNQSTSIPSFFAGVSTGCLLAILVMAINHMENKPQPNPGTDSIENARLTNLDAVWDDTNDKNDKIVTYDPGVHVFPGKDFPQRLAEFIDQNHQTIIVCVCPLHGPGGPKYLVHTRPDPEWLKILPGVARPPDRHP